MSFFSNQDKPVFSGKSVEVQETAYLKKSAAVQTILDGYTAIPGATPVYYGGRPHKIMLAGLPVKRVAKSAGSGLESFVYDLAGDGDAIDGLIISVEEDQYNNVGADQVFTVGVRLAGKMVFEMSDSEYASFNDGELTASVVGTGTKRVKVGPSQDPKILVVAKKLQFDGTKSVVIVKTQI